MKSHHIEEHRHDPYKARGELPEPSVCPQCSAVFVNGRWQWSKDALAGAHSHVCPACHRITDKYPAGELTLTSSFVAKRASEIVGLIRNIEAAEKPIAEIDDETLVLSDVAAKGLAQVERAVTELLADHMEPERAADLAKTLTSGRWTHDYAITAKEASELGLPVSLEMPADVLELVSLYPQPIRTVPSVEYLPYPHPQKARIER